MTIEARGAMTRIAVSIPGAAERRCATCGARRFLSPALVGWLKANQLSLKCPCCGSSVEPTFWNYQPTPCRIVRVVVGPSPRPTWWCATMAGQEREAVEVDYYGHKFYLDNADGSGWAKVTHGRGGPDWPHGELPVAEVLTAPVDAPAAAS